MRGSIWGELLYLAGIQPPCYFSISPRPFTLALHGRSGIRGAKKGGH